MGPTVPADPATGEQWNSRAVQSTVKRSVSRETYLVRALLPIMAVTHAIHLRNPERPHSLKVEIQAAKIGPPAFKPRCRLTANQAALTTACRRPQTTDCGRIGTAVRRTETNSFLEPLCYELLIFHWLYVTFNEQQGRGRKGIAVPRTETRSLRKVVANCCVRVLLGPRRVLPTTCVLTSGVCCVRVLLGPRRVLPTTCVLHKCLKCYIGFIVRGG